MNSESLQVFWFFSIFIGILFVIGFYYIMITYNLIRVLIGLELLTKAVTILLIVAGYLSGCIALAQALVITLIVVEVVVITVAAGVVLGLFHHNNSLDTRRARNLRG